MQFLWGLIAGVIVGLVMEWVIDWSSLMPRRQRRKVIGGRPGAASGGAASVLRSTEADTSQNLQNVTPRDKD